MLRTMASIFCIAFIFCLTPLATQGIYEFNGHSYTPIPIPSGTTWHQARDSAVALGGHLLTITSQAESDFIVTILNDINTTGCFVGGTDELIEGEWHWVTGEPFEYTNWGSGEPNNSNGGEDYLFIGTSGGGVWNDGWGYIPYDGHFIVEKNSSGFNCALSAETMAQSFHNLEKDPPKAVDGSYSTFWSSGGAVPRWWMVKLDNNYIIEQLYFRIRGDDLPLCYGQPCYDYEIYGSLDSLTWFLLATESSTTQAYYDYLGLDKACKFIKVVFTMSNDWAGWCNIVELETYTNSICGDANSDFTVDVGDAVYLIANIFALGPPPNPLIAGDSNGDGDVNVGDAVFIINFIFRSGDEPICP